MDAKLLALARSRSRVILTNDVNLNRVAELQGVRVMNINSLANAVKPAVLPGEEEYGRRRRGLIYANGLYGASSELWIPLEAVFAVYPETGAALLAAKGDETEHFGWNRPPESFRRDDVRPHQPPSSF